MSHEVVHMGRCSYAPVEYVQFTIGVGGDRFAVDDYEGRSFDGRYGLVALGGLSLYTPAFAAGALRVGASVTYQRLNSTDDYGYEYRGGVINPEGGIMIHAGRAIAIAAGARGHIIAGIMESTNETRVTGAAFSNGENIRGFFRFTLTAPSGAYGQLYFDASPLVSKELSGGPREAAIGFSVGVLIKEDRQSERIFDTNSTYFPAFEEMKEEEKRMREELKQ
jgi:hypothetical protein